MNLDLSKWAFLWIMFIIHWVIIFVYVFYYGLSRAITIDKSVLLRMDVAFVIGAIVILSHWRVFKYECIISYIEKKIANPDYILGSEPLINPSLFIGYPVSMMNKAVQFCIFIVWGIVAVNIAFIIGDYFEEYRIFIAVGIMLLYLIFLMCVKTLYQPFTQSHSVS